MLLNKPLITKLLTKMKDMPSVYIMVGISRSELLLTTIGLNISGSQLCNLVDFCTNSFFNGINKKTH
jgi:hypothetical protein